MLASNQATAEEFAPFRLTGVDGEAFIRYFSEEHSSSNAGLISTNREGDTFEEGFDLTLHSYIYHPKMLELDFGGGPVFTQSRFKSDSTFVSDGEQALNLHATADILKDKPYPTRVYYDKKSSSSTHAVEERMILKRESYGLNFLHKEMPYDSVLNMELSSTENQGSNSERVVDNKIDRFSITGSTSLGEQGDGSIGLFWTEEYSASGSTLLPIAPITIVNQSLDIQTEQLLGADQQFRLSNYFVYETQDLSPTREEVRYTPNLYWRISDDLNSSIYYGFLDRELNNIEVTTHSVDLSVNHWALEKRLESNVDLHADRFEAAEQVRDYYSGRLRLGYRQKWDGFDVRYSLGLGADRTDRNTVTDTIAVIAEAHTLTGVSSVALVHSFVVDGAVTVTNSARTQTFIEGVDYRLLTVGEVTSIQRVPGGGIADGEQILVDYQYQTGGTTVFSSLSSIYRIDVSRGNIFHLYGQYSEIEYSIDSGMTTIPLNSHQTYSYGSDLDFPITDEWTIGGNLEYENRSAEIGSYERTNTGIFLEKDRILKGNIRIFADKSSVDNLDSPEDVELVRFGIRYRARPWRRATLIADFIEENDTGGTRETESTYLNIKLDWKIRALKVLGDVRVRRDRVGDSERDNRSINIYLIREF